AAVDDAAAVDEQVAHAGGVLVRLVEGGAVAERLRVEHHHVGVVTRPQVAAVLQPQDVRRQAAGTPQGGLQRDDALRHGVVPGLAREAAVAARVRYRRGRDLGAAVAGGGHEVLLHDQAHVFLAHAEAYHAGAAVAFDLQHHVQDALVALPGDGGEAL